MANLVLATDAGCDGHNLRRVPWTINEATLSPEVQRLIRESEAAHNRVRTWKQFLETYPEKIMDDRVTYATTLGLALVGSPVWFVGGLAVIGFGYLVGFGWLFVPWLFTSFTVFAGLMVANAFRNRRYQEPMELALKDSAHHIVIFQLLLFFFPALVAWSGWHTLNAFVAQTNPLPNDENVKALGVMRDTRVRMAIALTAGIKRLNLLAYQLKQELDYRRSHGEPKPGEKALNIAMARETLHQLREAVFRNYHFLQSTHDDAPLGDFHSDIAGLLLDLEERIEQSEGALAESREKVTAQLELQAAMAGVSGAMAKQY